MKARVEDVERAIEYRNSIVSNTSLAQVAVGVLALLACWCETRDENFNNHTIGREPFI